MAAKIKDGLFIGDAETSQSEDFINDNKISNLINLSGREVPNYWASHGLVYLTFNWEDRPEYKLGLTSYRKPGDVNSKGDVIGDMVDFIDVSIQHGISVLIFSRNGTSRCAVAACAYLMIKYKWGFQKSYEFVFSKKPDININRGFIQQMFAFDKHLLIQSVKGEKQQKITAQLRNDHSDPATILNLVASAALTRPEMMVWGEWGDGSKQQKRIPQLDLIDYDNDEALLTNSFVNSKHTITQLPGPYRGIMDIPKSFKLRFSDINWEEDINMFPTEPPDPRVLELPPGVLRVKLDLGASIGRQQAPQKSKSGTDSRVQQSGMNKDAKYGDHKVSQYIHGSDIGDTDSVISDVSFSADPMAASPRFSNGVNSKSSISQAKQVTNPKSRSSVDLGLDPYSQADDLYGYVGVSRGHIRDEHQHNMMSSNIIEPPSSQSQQKNYVNTSNQMTAEERLRHLVADMQQGSRSGGESKAQSQQGQYNTGFQSNAPNSRRSMQANSDVSSVGEDHVNEGAYSTNGNMRMNGLSQGSVTSIGSASVASSTPSLYDIANMHVPSSAPMNYGSSSNRSTRTPIQAGSSSSKRNENPLQAFEQLQRSGAVRVSRDVVLGMDRGTGGSNVAMRRSQNAWGDDPNAPLGVSGSQAPMNGGGNVQNTQRVSPRSASPQLGTQRQQGVEQTARTYRHGSPAPRINTKPGQSSRAKGSEVPQSSSQRSNGVANNVYNGGNGQTVRGTSPLPSRSLDPSGGIGGVNSTLLHPTSSSTRRGSFSGNSMPGSGSNAGMMGGGASSSGIPGGNKQAPTSSSMGRKPSPLPSRGGPMSQQQQQQQYQHQQQQQQSSLRNSGRFSSPMTGRPTSNVASSQHYQGGQPQRTATPTRMSWKF